MISKLRYGLTITFLLLNSYGYAQKYSWEKTTIIEKNNLSEFYINEEKVEIFELDLDAFKKQIANAPLRNFNNKKAGRLIQIPGYNGNPENFYVYEVSVFSESLSAKYPNIKSYIGFSSDNSGAQLRMSVSPNGIQTMITYLDKPTVFLQPLSHGNKNYVLYDKNSKTKYEDPFECNTIEDINKSFDNSITNRDANDGILRSFRIAVSTNGEYTTYHGGTVEGALAAINATLTRLNAVFETDMAVTFVLVDAPELIFTDASSDPYSTNLNDWNLQLQNTLTTTIGNAAYDIGHMFGATGGGGNAGCIGCVCIDDSASTNDINKGGGITSPSNGIPEGDTFDLDFVAHEIGHQMGANHTWAFDTEGTGVNSEPGSGTTIMAYAGITGANNVQQNGDDYFHYHSINQILNNLDTKSCATVTPITNNPPVANAGNDFTIPTGTAYILKGSATDPNGGDTLSYCWEQIDSGQVTNTSFGPTLTSGSMNRSLPPSSTSDRYIPKLDRVITGQLRQTNPTINSAWETVSIVGRTLNWALTVRDREPTAVGLNGQSSFDLMQITVDANSGPFIVTSQSSNVTWDVGSNQTVTWDVAGTDSGQVNTPNVNIKLSIDGGLTYPFNLASNVPNNGSADIIVPDTGIDSNTARVMVEGNNNIFYAINSINFNIQKSEFAIAISNNLIDVCSPSDALYNFTYNTFLGFTGTTTFSTLGLPSGAVATFNPTSASANGTLVTLIISGTSTVGVGNYIFDVVGTSGSIVKDSNASLNIFSNSFNSTTLSSPSNGAINIPVSTNLSWDNDSNAQAFDIEIASDAGFTNIVESATVSSNLFTTNLLASNTNYFWRVKPKNLCGDGIFSSIFSFTTQNISCQSFNSNNTPTNIPDNNATGITSIINIATSETVLITDVNLTLNVTHPWIGDLTVSLTSPNGTEITLISSRTDDGNNYSNTTFDDDASSLINTGSAPFTGSFRPEQPLSIFNSEFSNGNWLLKIVDSGPADIGTLDNWSIEICGSPPSDSDADGVFDNIDNCNSISNADQADFDNDGIGDVCDDDIDNDGILNVNDTCNDTPLGDTVDVNGCSVFSLPSNNFNLQISSETCRNSNNGSISISAIETFNYVAQLTGNGVNISNNFTSSTVFSGIEAGNYTICITVSGEADYSLCYNVTITEPDDLSVISKIDTLTGKVQLGLSGSNSYTINLNGSIIKTSDSNIILDLVTGINKLQINTDKECQGLYSETINNVSKTILTPNPIGEELLNIYVNNNIEQIRVYVYSSIGKLLFTKNMTTINGKSNLNLSNLSSGIYIINVNTGESQSNHKIIKK